MQISTYAQQTLEHFSFDKSVEDMILKKEKVGFHILRCLLTRNSAIAAKESHSAWASTISPSNSTVGLRDKTVGDADMTLLWKA